jgi:hypothetical protein
MRCVDRLRIAIFTFALMQQPPGQLSRAAAQSGDFDSAEEF